MPKVNETFTVEGLDSLRKVFERLPPVVAQRVARRALYRGAIPIRDAARSKVSIRYGALKRAIIVQTGQELAEAGIDVRIRADGTNTNYTKFQRTGNVKVYVTIDKRYFRRQVTKSGKVRYKALRRKEPNVGRPNQRVYPRRYAHLVEFGTLPHAIGEGSKLLREYEKTYKRAWRVNGTLRRKGETYINSTGGKQSGPMHPGSKAQPFMRPAFDEQSETALNIIAEEAGKQLSAELLKLTSASKKSTK